MNPFKRKAPPAESAPPGCERREPQYAGNVVPAMETDFSAIFTELFDATTTHQSVGDLTNIMASNRSEDIEVVQGFFAKMLDDPLAYERSTRAGDLICAKAEFDELQTLLIGATEDVVQLDATILPAAPTPASVSPTNRDTMNKRARSLTRQDLSARMSAHYRHGLWREWETMMKSCIGDAEFDERKALSFLVG